MKLVIFDCDGTLVDSQHSIVAAMNQAFASEKLQAPTRAMTLSIVGLSLPEVFETLHPKGTPQQRTRLAEAYKVGFQTGLLADAAAGRSQHEPLFPGVGEAIPKLATRADIVLGIATGKSMRGVQRVLDQEGWQGYFKTIQTADNNPSKPAPGMVLKAMEQATAHLGLAPKHVIMVGDTTYDIEMAKSAGATAIGVTWGYHTGHALRQAGAHVLVGSMDALLVEIDKVGR